MQLLQIFCSCGNFHFLKFDQIGFTALIAAASKGHTSIVEKLLDHGAEVNVADPVILEVNV